MTEETAITIRLGSLEIASPEDVIRRATSISKELVKVVEDRKLYTVISGRKFVRVEGWETLGAMLGIMPREVNTLRHEDGTYESTVELVRVDGAMIGRGSAIVGIDEKTWSQRPEYARRSMAITRATGKAYRLSLSWIMALAGYEPTPAEEMDGVIVEGQIVEPPKIEQLKPEKKAEPTSANGKDAIYLAIVETGLSENKFAAKTALNKYCKTGYDTPEKAITWMRNYGGWRDMGATVEQAAENANKGNVPK